MIVLLDLRLPDVRRRDVLAALKLDPITAEMPVVGASADQIDELMQASARAYLTRPLELKMYPDMIATLTPESGRMETA